MKKFYLLFVYISLIFLVLYLVNSNYLHVPEIKSYLMLVLSFVLLFIGFLLNTFAYQHLLKTNNIKTSYIEASASTGLSIFGKYIPGKLWVTVGRASYIASSQKRNDFIYISGVSFMGQIIGILTGILIGSQFFWWYPTQGGIITFCFTLFLLLTIILPYPKVIIEKISFPKNKTLRSVRHLIGPHLIKILPWYSFFWLFWGLGFYLLSISLLGQVTSFSVAFTFILGGAISVIIFIMPGGIGVREGALVFLLTKNGFSADVATTIAVSSRLWFLIGEFFMFFWGSIANRLKERNSN